MSQPLPSFMAAQRKQCTINSNRPYYSSSQPWTAGRCQRLLRPITSRIELLRKDSIRYTATGNPDSVPILATSATAPSNKCLEVSSEREEEDKYWEKGTKRVWRTYSARRKLQNIPYGDQVHANQKEKQREHSGRKVRLQPGEFLVPTPILNRSKSFLVDSSRDLQLELSPVAPLKFRNVKRPGPRHTAKNEEPQFEFADAMRRIKKTANAPRFKVYDGICNALEALFKATILHEEQVLSVSDTTRSPLNTFSQAPKVPRSRSLFATCLRCVPNFIEKEEKRFAIEAEAKCQKSAFDTPIISTEMYADLESLGTSEAGWKHLKTVVRAHGVLIVSDAIEDGLLNADIASALVMLCVHTSFLDEAETLLTSLVKASIYPDPKSPQSNFRDDPALLPLLTLENFAKYTGRICYYHRQITNIITNGSLSVTWLGTKHFASVWTSLFRSLSIDPFDRDATKFITSVVPLLCRTQSSRFGKHEHSSWDQSSMLPVLNATQAGVLTTLLSMSILSISHRNISQTLKAIIIECQLGPSELQSRGAALILIANILGTAEMDEDAGFLKQLVGLLRCKSCESLESLNSSDCIPFFVCSVARCCGRGSSGDVFEHLKILLERLMAISSLVSSEGSGVLEQIVADCAFIFADHLPDSKHLQFAQQIRAHMHGLFIESRTLRSKGKSRFGKGFHWEEGINEWVIATPTVRLTARQKRRVSLADEDSGSETSTQSVKRHCKTETALHKRGRICLNRYNRITELAPNSPKECHDVIDSQVWKGYPTQDEFLRTQYLLRAPPRLTRSSPRRRTITKMRRLGCKLPCSSQNWILFEHSDDELNPTTKISSGYAQLALEDLPNSIKCFRSPAQRRSQIFDKGAEGRGGRLEEMSADELGL